MRKRASSCTRTSSRLLGLALTLTATPCFAQPVARFPDVPPDAARRAAPAPPPKPAAESRRPPWPESAAEQWLARGNEYATRGDLGRAFAAYLEALRIDPGSGQAYLGLGRLRELMGDPREAERCYTSAALVEPTRAEALALRAHLRRRLGRTSEASRDLELSLSFDPSARARWDELGQWYVQASAWPAALALYRRLLSSAEAKNLVEESARLKLQVAALTVLAAEADPVTADRGGRPNWVRRSLATIARMGQ
jgi:tetratricopeptide (TPR) repeat protein